MTKKEKKTFYEGGGCVSLREKLVPRLMQNEKVWPEGGRLNLEVQLIKGSLHLGIQTQLMSKRQIFLSCLIWKK